MKTGFATQRSVATSSLHRRIGLNSRAALGQDMLRTRQSCRDRRSPRSIEHPQQSIDSNGSPLNVTSIFDAVNTDRSHHTSVN